MLIKYGITTGEFTAEQAMALREWLADCPVPEYRKGIYAALDACERVDAKARRDAASALRGLDKLVYDRISRDRSVDVEALARELGHDRSAPVWSAIMRLEKARLVRPRDGDEIARH